jgi:hypothetical protein
MQVKGELPMKIKVKKMDFPSGDYMLQSGFHPYGYSKALSIVRICIVCACCMWLHSCRCRVCMEFDMLLLCSAWLMLLVRQASWDARVKVVPPPPGFVVFS